MTLGMGAASRRDFAVGAVFGRSLPLVCRVSSRFVRWQPALGPPAISSHLECEEPPHLAVAGEGYPRRHPKSPPPPGMGGGIWGGAGLLWEAVTGILGGLRH